MSLESAKAYLERMKTDKEFAKKIIACKNSEERRALAKAEGFSFSSEELNQVNEELSDDDLDAVAGAGCLVDTCGLNEIF